jgi:DNA-binding FadR family transcriptional regulator
MRLNQAVARRIGMAILSGELAPGDSLGGEIEQSLQLGVSRTAYREAMRSLISKGLIESRPKAGTHVTPRSTWNLLDPEILAWMFSGKPDKHFVRDLFELRGIIEPAVARLAAQRRSGEQLAAMEQALTQMAENGLGCEAGQEADRQFHRLLLEATGNEALTTLAGSVGAAVQWTTRFKQQASARPRDPIPEHQAVFAAVAAGDGAAAAEQMSMLLERALDDMHSVEDG